MKQNKRILSQNTGKQQIFDSFFDLSPYRCLLHVCMENEIMHMNTLLLCIKKFLIGDLHLSFLEASSKWRFAENISFLKEEIGKERVWVWVLGEMEKE